MSFCCLFRIEFFFICFFCPFSFFFIAPKQYSHGTLLVLCYFPFSFTEMSHTHTHTFAAYIQRDKSCHVTIVVHFSLFEIDLVFCCVSGGKFRAEIDISIPCDGSQVGWVFTDRKLLLWYF